MEVKEQMTVIIAEDDAGHARLLELLLAEAGLRNPVIRFKDGTEVWEFISGKSGARLQPGRSCLLLLDLRMPGMGGMEVLERLKAAPHLKENLRVIISSCTDDSAELDRCRRLGCDGFLPKPVDAEKLAAIINQPNPEK